MRTEQSTANRTRMVVSHFIRHSQPQDPNAQIPPITKAKWEEISKRSLPPPKEQANNLLQWIGGELNGDTAGKVWLTPPLLSAFIGAMDNGATLDTLVNALRKRGLLTAEVERKEDGVSQPHVGLTLDGWDEYHNLNAALGSSVPPVKEAASVNEPPYVSEVRLAALRAIKSNNFDLSKLIRLCEELNSNYTARNYYSVAMLLRAILDHIPPIFGVQDFASVIGQHGGRSFKDQMRKLEDFLRNIADQFLHQQIRRREAPPTDTQVHFAQPLDTLLGEVVAKLT